MKLHIWFICGFLIPFTHGEYNSTTEQIEALVDLKNSNNKPETDDTNDEEMSEVLQFSNTIEDKDARILFLQEKVQKLKKENSQLLSENEQLKLKMRAMQNGIDTSGGVLRNFNNSRSDNEDILLLLEKFESSLQLCDENYRCAKNEIFQLELDKTDAELKLNRCSNVLANTQNAVNNEISTVISLQNSVSQLNASFIQVQSQLNLCERSKVVNNDSVQCHVQLESLGLEFIGYKEHFRKLHAKVSDTENEIQTCVKKVLDLNKKLAQKTNDAEELSDSLKECMRKIDTVSNHTRIIQNEVRENIKIFEQSVSAAMEGKFTTLESKLQNKLFSTLSHNVSTLTSSLDAVKNLSDVQNRILTSKMNTFSHETHALNKSIINGLDALKNTNDAQNLRLTSQINSLSQETSALSNSIISIRGDSKKQRGLERLRQTGGLVDLGGEWFYLRSDPAVPWAHAYSLCKELGMQMVILDSKAKNDKIMNYIKNNQQFKSKEFWIGMLRVSKPTGGYSWVWQGTLEEVNYNSWDIHEPTNIVVEECVEIWNKRNPIFAWNNKACEDKNGVICELIQ